MGLSFTLTVFGPVLYWIVYPLKERWYDKGKRKRFYAVMTPIGIIFLLCLGAAFLAPYVQEGKASIVVGNLEVNPKTADPRETVTVTATVKNEGSLEGSKEFNLKVDGEVADTYKISLEPGESRTINFEISSGKEGTHNIKLENQSIEFEVKKPFIDVLDAKKSADGTVMQFKIRLYNTKANDILWGNPPIEISEANFKLKTKDGRIFKHYQLLKAPNEIAPNEEASFSVMFSGLPKNLELSKIGYDAPAEKAVWAEIGKIPFSTLRGWLPVTKFSGCMLSDTLDKTETFKISEDNWRINWKVEKIPFTPEGAAFEFIVVREDGMGGIGGDTIVLVFEDVKEGSLDFHQKGRFHIKLLGKYVYWRLGVEEFAGGEKPTPKKAGQILWSKTFGGSGNDKFSSVVQTNDGGYLVAGTTESFGAGGSDIYIIKVDSSGNEEWGETYGGSEDEEIGGHGSLARTKDDGFALVGTTNSFGADKDIYLLKIDSSGHKEWSKTYGPDADRGQSLVQTQDGGYAVLGSTNVGNEDVYLLKTDFSGDVEWSKTYGGSGRDKGWNLIQTCDGGFAIASPTTSYGSGGWDSWFIKTDFSGNIEWKKTYGGSTYDAPNGLIQTSEGYAIAGVQSLEPDLFLLKTNSKGVKKWKKTYGGSETDRGFSLIQTEDGGFAMAGFTESFGGGERDVFTVKTDTSGRSKWRGTYGGSGDERGNSVIQTQDDNFLIAGWTKSFGKGGKDGWLVKVRGG